MRRRDAALELDVAAQVELVGDMVEIAQRFRLRGEVLLPVPFLEQFGREREPVGPALGIEAGAGVAVPVPSAADPGAGLEHPRPEAEFAQLVKLVKPRHPGADDDRVKLRFAFAFDVSRRRLQSTHALVPSSVIPGRGAAANPEPMNTEFSQRALVR